MSDIQNIQGLEGLRWATMRDAVARILSRPLADASGEMLAIAALCPILLSVALWNGFPITFFDTGAYMLQGLGHFFVPERSPVYSLFLKFAGGRESLWFVVIAQSAVSAFVLTEFARVEAPRMALGLFLAVLGAMTFLTAIAWYVGEIEPDCFTALTALCLWMMAFRWQRLGRARGVLAMGAGVLCIASHPSHLGLAAGLVLLVALLKLIAVATRKRSLPPANVMLCLTAFLLGVATVMASNYAFTGRIFLSRSGPVFMVARLMEDGILQKYLSQACPTEHYRLCAFRDHLPDRADDYLWEEGSVFTRLGRFKGTAAESEKIVDNILRQYTGQVALIALRNGAIQSGYFLTGDGIEPQEWVLNVEFERFIPQQFTAYTSARQQHGQLHFLALNVVHVGVALVSMAALAWFLFDALRRRRWRRAALPAFVAAALLGNALICGALSGPHGRYQSRIIWLPTLVLALNMRPKPRFALRSVVESGT